MRQFPCERCPLRAIDVFRKFTDDELEFVSGFKTGEHNAEVGATLLTQGSSSAQIFTVLSGWGFRYKDLDDGRRQILNYVFPGELIGLQGAVLKEMEHSVQALSDMVLCVFERRRLWELYEKHPALGFDITWLAAREEQILEDHLLSIGRRTAIERMAYLLLHIYDRARRVGMTTKNGFETALTQQHVSDTLGLSLVHTNKTLRKLYDMKLVSWKRRMLQILDFDALAEVAKWSRVDEDSRPFI